MKKMTALIALLALLLSAALPAGAEGWFTLPSGALPTGILYYNGQGGTP